MRIDPSTTIRDLIAAIPSSEAVLKRLGVSKGPPDGRTLEQACTEARIPIENFLNTLEGIDWNAEAPPRNSSRPR